GFLLSKDLNIGSAGLRPYATIYDATEEALRFGGAPVVGFITPSWLLCIRRLAETNTRVWNLNRFVGTLGVRCCRLFKHDVDFRSGRNADDNMFHGQHLHDLFV